MLVLKDESFACRLETCLLGLILELVRALALRMVLVDLETCLLGILLELVRALELRMFFVDLEICLIGLILEMVSTLTLYTQRQKLSTS